MTDIPLAVIDDEPAIRRLVLRVFTRRSGTVAYASAEDFLAAFDGSKPHLLVVDKNLTGITGLQMIEQHRERAKAPFEAVLITGYADTDSALSAMQLGFYSYLRKPFQTEELVYAVAGAEERLKLKLQLQRAENLLNREQQTVGETIGAYAERMRVMRAEQLQEAMSDRLGTLERMAASVAEELERSFVASEQELLDQLVPSLTAAADTVREQSDRGQGSPRSSSSDAAASAAVQGHLARMKELATDLRVLTHEGARDSVIDLRDVVRAGTRIAAPVVAKRGELVVDMPDAPTRIYGSPQQLAQVVINLLLNAGDAVADKQGGLVAVGIERDPPFAVLVVKDNGCGIAEDRLSQVFNPFVGDKPAGKGVGLTIVQNTVAEHQGQVVLESAEGQGTEVRVRLPLARRPKTDRLQTVATGEEPIANRLVEAEDEGDGSSAEEPSVPDPNKGFSN